ncbi:MAG TPA: hypothetical protein VFW68_03115 [Rhodocyclaceae bacterium]|nr:hypothetical protein [Rhodocyclaceae bacterium]
MASEDDPVQQAVRRQTGIAALRRLRKMVDDEVAQDRLHARWARRLGVVLVVAAIVAVVWLAQRAPH